MFKNLIAGITLATMTIAGTASVAWSKTRMVTDHMGNKVTVPAEPKRVASLHTMSTTVMLWDLGVPLIGTATRVKKDENNRQYIRSVEEIYNVKFQDTKLFSYGSFGKDIEQIKASKPDLIVGTVRHAKVYKQLSAIAPTVLIDYLSPDMLKIYGDLATWVGKEDKFETQLAEFKLRTAKVRQKFSTDPSKQTIGYAAPYPGKAQYLARINYGAMTAVAYELGFKPAPFLVKQFGTDATGGKLSSETFAEFQSDWLMSTYRNQTGETIETVYAGFDDIAPGWRDYNSAYRDGKFIATNREKSYPISFTTMHLLLDAFEKHAK